jgi:hypothetical protein
MHKNAEHLKNIFANVYIKDAVERNEIQNVASHILSGRIKENDMAARRCMGNRDKKRCV